MSNVDVATLNSLIATTIDSAVGFEEAAERVRAGGLASRFTELARDRREVVETLQQEVTSLGGTAATAGTTKAAAHRRWLDLKSSVVSSDRAVLQEVENGETYLRTKYEAALAAKSVSETARRAITEASASVRRGHDSVAVLNAEYSVGLPDEREINWRAVGAGLGVAAAVGGAIFAVRRRSGRSSTTDRRTSPSKSSTNSGSKLEVAEGLKARPKTKPKSAKLAKDGSDQATPVEGKPSRVRRSSGHSAPDRLAAAGAEDGQLGRDDSPPSGFGSEGGAGMGSFSAGPSDNGFGRR